MTDLPSLYKARGVPLKQPVCAICLDRTRGKTLERELTHGVRIWLCEGHHSVAFLRSNAGRDFAVTLLRTWRAHGCLTRARSRALDAHLRGCSFARAGAARAGGRARTHGRGCGAKPRRRSRSATGVFATIARLRARHARDHATRAEHSHHAEVVRAGPLAPRPKRAA